MKKKIDKKTLLLFLLGNPKRTSLRDISSSPKHKPDLDLRKTTSKTHYYLTASWHYKVEGKPQVGEEILALTNRADETVQVMEITKLEKENQPIGKTLVKRAKSLGLSVKEVTQFRI